MILSDFLKKGLIWPSSQALAKSLIKNTGLERADTVVELGCGSGPITQAISNNIKHGTQLIGIDIDSDMISKLTEKFPQHKFVCDGAQNTHKYAQEVDVIISSLPWTLFPSDFQLTLLKEIKNVLKQGGVFATFAYVNSPMLPTFWTFKKQLQENFHEAQISDVVFKNIPPAFIYRCRK